MILKKSWKVGLGFLGPIFSVNQLSRVVLGSCDVGILSPATAFLTSRQGWATSAHATSRILCVVTSCCPAFLGEVQTHILDWPWVGRDLTMHTLHYNLNLGAQIQLPKSFWSLYKSVVSVEVPCENQEWKVKLKLLEMSRMSQGKSLWKNLRAARMGSKKVLIQFLMLLTSKQVSVSKSCLSTRN